MLLSFFHVGNTGSNPVGDDKNLSIAARLFYFKRLRVANLYLFGQFFALDFRHREIVRQRRMDESTVVFEDGHERPLGRSRYTHFERFVMSNERIALLVPHGKQGVTLENLAHNLDALSVLVSTFVAMTVRKHPELKSETIETLQDIYTQGRSVA
jgi:hypothetical protein